MFVCRIPPHNRTNPQVLSTFQGDDLGKGGIDLVPSEERIGPQAPSQFQFDASNNPEAITGRVEGAVTPAPESEGAASESSERKLLPRETGHDIGMGSPVPLSAEAVGIITRLRNLKVRRLRSLCPSDRIELKRSTSHRTRRRTGAAGETWFSVRRPRSPHMGLPSPFPLRTSGNGAAPRSHPRRAHRWIAARGRLAHPRLRSSTSFQHQHQPFLSKNH